MSLLSVLLLAFALSLDTFAVALSVGLAPGLIPKFIKFRYVAIIAVFHFFMPLVGWLLGDAVHVYIKDYDHWLAFILLAGLGVKMIREAYIDNDEGADVKCFTSLLNTLLFGVALSVDAVIAGFSFSFTGVDLLSASVFKNVVLASFIIGVVAFFVTWLGLSLGCVWSSRLGRKAAYLGGTVLILLGLQVLISHIFNL